jgi:hypothetical protein
VRLPAALFSQWPPMLDCPPIADPEIIKKKAKQLDGEMLGNLDGPGSVVRGHLIILLTVVHIARPVSDGWIQQREKPRVRQTDLV